jgi:hypothetical protein
MGSHTFTVAATDSAGNTDAAPASYTWTITSSSPPPSGDPGPIAGDLYVSAAAPTGGSGTSSAPFNTVAACAAVVTAGHTCWVKSGTYSELNVCPKNSGTSESVRVTIAAYPGDSPVLDGGGRSGSAFDCWYKNYLTIRGLEVRNYVGGPTSNHSFGAAISLLHGLNPVVTRNVVHDILPSGSSSLAGIVAMVNQTGSTAVSPVTITSNEVYDIDSPTHSGDCGSGTGVCQGMGIWILAGDYVGGAVISQNYTHGAGKDGIRVECGNNSTTLTIENNVTVHNRNDGIDINNCFATSVLVRNNFAGWNGAQGLQPKHTDHVVMANNTLYGNATNGMFVNGDDPDGTTGNYGTIYGANWNLTLRDNVLAGGAWGGQITSGAYGLHPAVDYNLYSKPTSGLWWIDGVGGFSTLSSLRSATGWETHGIVADPLFVSTANGNFALQSGSPAAAASSAGGLLGADPAKLTGVGPARSYGLSNVPLAQW